MKNYRFFGEEAEVLGRRLDAARKSLETSNSKWVKQYGQQSVNQLLL
jgi:hypothetical protein